jgi:hypothetical protein
MKRPRIKSLFVVFAFLTLLTACGSNSENGTAGGDPGGSGAGASGGGSAGEGTGAGTAGTGGTAGSGTVSENARPTTEELLIILNE